MKNKILKKLKGRNGESLAEVLVAVLIVALSSAMFLSMVTASAEINRKTEKNDKIFYQAVSQLEPCSTVAAAERESEAEISEKSGEVQISVPKSESDLTESETVAVSLYSNDYNKLSSYK